MNKILPRIIFAVIILAAAYLGYQQFSGPVDTAFVPYTNTQLQE